jgi:hypothetical protein
MDGFSDKTTVAQLQKALEKCVHGGNFQAEIDAIHNEWSTPRTSNVLKLSPFLDQFGELRVGERIEKAPIDRGAIHPMLPHRHPFTSLVTKDAHERCFHSQIDRTLYEVQSRFGMRQGGAQGSEKVHRSRRRLSTPVRPHSPQLESPRISRRSLTLEWTICGCST